MISNFDILILFVYLIGMILIGYFSGKDNKTQEDYLLAGRSMPWIPIALSVTSTMISANGLIGGPGWAYTSGMGPFIVNLTVPLAIFFAIYVTIPVLYNLKVTSIYEYMEYRLGGITRNLTVAQFFINSIIQVSSMVFVPALIIQVITGWSLNLIVPLIVVIAIIYTLLGGIKAVIWTDTIQTIVVWIGVILSIIIPLKVMGMGFFETLNITKEVGKLNVLNFTFDLGVENTFWAGIIGGTFMWLRYFSFDQVQVQRVLTSKSIKGVKSSLALSGIIMNITYFLMLLIGMFLWVFYSGREFTDVNQIMINFILEELPIGIVGLVIAATFAAAMSSVDSLLNSMTTVFIKDIYEKYFYKGKEEVSLKVTMLISLILGIFIMFFVILGFGNTLTSVLETVGKYISYFSGPAAGSFILAMFTYKANDKGVATGFVLGFLINYLISINFDIFWLWNSAIGTLLTFTIGYLFSLIFKSDKSIEDIKRFTAKGMRKKLLEEGEIDKEVSMIPFELDRYGVIVLVFFFLQFILLFLMR